ncbi:MAG: SGNH/GDSL hydrolase family protein [Verrucomicrobiae bacterium]|nr:SGNH/GDSL hydrolase family protein [Verrucomicrobiae bacterium]
MRLLRLALANLVIAAVLLAATLVVVEGIAALRRASQPRTALVWNAWCAITGRRQQKARDAGQSFRAGRLNDEQRAVLRESALVDEADVAALLPALKAGGVVLGSTTFDELATPEARVTRDDPALGLCLKPDLDIRCGFLRSMCFSPLDPVTFSIRADDEPKLAAGADAFLRRYAFCPTSFRTDSRGDRVTLPNIERPDIVAVVGDSVAFGVMVGDDQTLASCLQRRDPSARYMNLGVPGSDAEGNLKRLGACLREFGDRVKGVVYVHCENDLGDLAPGWKPRDIADRLADMLDQSAIGYRVFVYQAYVYRTMPEILRNKVDASYFHARREIVDCARARGFAVVDLSDIVREHQEREGSLLAGFAIYVDHCHLSVQGTERVAAKIPVPRTPLAPAANKAEMR